MTENALRFDDPFSAEESIATVEANFLIREDSEVDEGYTAPIKNNLLFSTEGKAFKALIFGLGPVNLQPISWTLMVLLAVGRTGSRPYLLDECT